MALNDPSPIDTLDLESDHDGDVAMLEALRGELSGQHPGFVADPALNDRLRYALQLLGADA